MERINISGYKENEMYYNDEAFRIMNEKLIFLLQHDSFHILKQVSYNDEYKIKKLQIIKIEYQKTGFGYKKLFVCPVCGARRQFLYLHDYTLHFVCRNCKGSNVYRDRTSLYDENIENIIKYKIVQQLRLFSNPSPGLSIIDLPNGIPQRPRYMREEKYSLIYMRIAFLTWMYWQHAGGNRDFTTSEINEMLEEHNTRFVYENIIFAEIYPEAYKLLEEYEKANKC